MENNPKNPIIFSVGLAIGALICLALCTIIFNVKKQDYQIDVKPKHIEVWDGDRYVGKAYYFNVGIDSLITEDNK